MKYFAFEQDSGIKFFKTEQEAKSHAEKELEAYRDMASDSGWEECVTDICWGVVYEGVERTLYTPRPPKSEIDEETGEDRDGTFWQDHWDHIAAYKLKPIDEPKPAKT